MGAPEVSAYPYARWPRVSRAQARCLRRILRALSGRGPNRAQAEAEALLGARVRIAPAAPEGMSASEARAELRDPLVAVWLERAADARAVSMLCTLGPELGASLADRMLGGDGRPGHVAGAMLDDLSAGVLGYLAARMAIAADAELRVRGVLPDAARAHEALGGVHGRVLVFPLALELGGERCGQLRLFCDEDGAARIAGEPVARAVPAVLRTLPLTLCAHAGQIRLARSELDMLVRSDVVVPERCALARDGRGFAGQVWLHAIGSRRGGFACSARDDMLRIERVDDPGDTVMTQSKRIQTEALDTTERSSRVAADAPIELCLELARFTLPLEEVSALREGEVLCTGKPIGERITLSAHGRAFARGELVDVEGDVGVRITEML